MDFVRQQLTDSVIVIKDAHELAKQVFLVRVCVCVCACVRVCVRVDKDDSTGSLNVSLSCD